MILFEQERSLSAVKEKIGFEIYTKDKPPLAALLFSFKAFEKRIRQSPAAYA